MEMSGQTEEWFKQADYDLGTAEAMFRSRRYIYSIFMCHLCLEKALKDCWPNGVKPLRKVMTLFFSSTELQLICRSNMLSFWKC